MFLGIKLKKKFAFIMVTHTFKPQAMSGSNQFIQKIFFNKLTLLHKKRDECCTCNPRNLKFK